MATGIVSGIISGLIASAVILLISYLAKPRFELRIASGDAVTLHHNRFRPVVIGRTWEFGHGSQLFCTPDARAAVHGILVTGFSETNLRNTGMVRPIGSSIDVAYRLAPPFCKWREKELQAIQSWEFDPGELVGGLRRKDDGWKVDQLTPVIHGDLRIAGRK